MAASITSTLRKIHRCIGKYKMQKGRQWFGQTLCANTFSSPLQILRFPLSFPCYFRHERCACNVTWNHIYSTAYPLSLKLLNIRWCITFPWRETRYWLKRWNLSARARHTNMMNKSAKFHVKVAMKLIISVKVAAVKL